MHKYGVYTAFHLSKYGVYILMYTSYARTHIHLVYYIPLI